jgi:hypothetical protein
MNVDLPTPVSPKSNTLISCTGVDGCLRGGGVGIRGGGDGCLCSGIIDGVCIRGGGDGTLRDRFDGVGEGSCSTLEDGRADGIRGG